MNSRMITGILSVGLLASVDASASMARLGVMGTAGGSVVGEGSLYYQDRYNMFYNPAHINNVDSFTILELDRMAGGVLDLSGFKVGGFVTGSPDGSPNPLNLVFGGDTGLKWGLGVNVLSVNDGDDMSNEVVLHAGIDINGIQPFFTFRVLNDLSDADYMRAGVRYEMGEWTPFAAYSNNNDDDNVLIGVGRNTEIANGASLNYALSFIRGLEAETNTLPLDVSIEADALSWLTLRGGMSYALLAANADGVTDTSAERASVRAGGAFHIGGAMVDFGVSTNGGSAGFGENLFSDISLSYNF
jgi:hypothetical protein